MVAVARPREEAASQPQSTRAEMYAAFDAMLALGGIGAALCLFEHDHPGGLAALRAWGEAHDIPLVERQVVGRPGCYVLRANSEAYEVDIAVHADHAELQS